MKDSTIEALNKMTKLLAENMTEAEMLDITRNEEIIDLFDTLRVAMEMQD
jgi:hypothetical protein